MDLDSTSVKSDLIKERGNCWQEQKQESPIFAVKYGYRIANDMGLPFSTCGEKESVWEELGVMKSFTQSLEFVKGGRWMSWNSAAQATGS
jgi:hypothetical protein